VCGGTDVLIHVVRRPLVLNLRLNTMGDRQRHRRASFVLSGRPPRPQQSLRGCEKCSRNAQCSIGLVIAGSSPRERRPRCPERFNLGTCYDPIPA